MIHIADIVFAGAVIVVAYIGMKRGAIGQLTVGLGTFIGFFAAAWLFNNLASLAADSHVRLVLLTLLLLAIMFFWYSMALTVNVWIRHHFRHLFKRFVFFDRATGLVFGVFFAGINLLILTIVFDSVLPTFIARQIVQSDVVSSASNSDILPTVFRTTAHLLQPFASPKVFANDEPTFAYNEPTNWTESLPKVAAQVQASMVKVEAWGCGTESLGSGFWVGEHTIVTNAHVVAGSTRLSVENDSGVYTARLVAFDPNTDYAVLATENDVSGKPLSFDTSALATDTQVVTLGYPNGDSLVTSNAVILKLLQADGYDIYNINHVTRPVYALHGTIVPGDSGGPLVTDQGTVAGLVFGNSTAQDSVGYAIAASQLVHGILSASLKNQVVSSGSCTSE